MREDKGGHFWNIAAGALLGGIINGFSQVITNLVTESEWNSGLLGAFVTGAASGALAASGVVAKYQAIGNAFIAGASEFANQRDAYMKNSEDFNLGKAILSVASSAFFGGVSGYMGGDGVRAQGTDYKYALDKLEYVTERVKNNVYSNSSTVVKLLSRGKAMVYATGKTATIQTSIKFYAGAQLSQYGMSVIGMILK